MKLFKTSRPVGQNPLPTGPEQTSVHSAPILTEFDLLNEAQIQAEATAQFHAQAHAEATAQALAYAQAANNYMSENHTISPMVQTAPITTGTLAYDQGFETEFVDTHSREDPSISISEHLRKNRHKEAVSALILALLVALGIGITLYLVKILQIGTDTPTIVTYRAFVEEDDLPERLVTLTTNRLPAAPSSSSSARLIASTAPSTLSVTIPDVVETNDFGFSMADLDASGGGAGWTSGSGTIVEASKDTAGFGSVGGSGLKGNLYDFKQDRERLPNKKYLTANRRSSRLDHFLSNLNEIHRKKFSEESLQPYYKSSQELTLGHLAIPPSPASDGPRYFGAAEEVQPKGWIAHYSGKLTVPESGSYRFCGMADDYMSLFVNGTPHLHASWPEVQAGLARRWKAHRDSRKWTSPIGGHKLIFGRWMTLRKGQVIDIDLGIGERPGGKLAYLLMVEKQGADYELEPRTKRPILPIFTTAPFSEEQQRKISGLFPNFPFEWEKVPVFSPANSEKPRLSSL